VFKHFDASPTLLLFKSTATQEDENNATHYRETNRNFQTRVTLKYPNVNLEHSLVDDYKNRYRVIDLS
jgi:hypothetical protein